MKKTYLTDGVAPVSQIGATLESLYATIEQRRDSGDESSYTNRLIQGPLDALLKKISEEALEADLAAKECQMLDMHTDDVELFDASVDHMRYESADVIYHLLVLLARFDVPIDELAAELNARMKESERPEGCVMLEKEHVQRGK